MATLNEVSADVVLENQPDLAAMRTLMAADRTLMAWIRTSLSLLSFGYTIYKILQELEGTGHLLPRDSTPRNTGVFLTVAGTMALVMGIAEYCGTLRLLRRVHVVGLARPSLIMSVVMAFVSVFLVVGIVANLL